jgi:hypothetical protein
MSCPVVPSSATRIAGTRNRDRSGRQPDARCHGQIELFRDWADLPFEGRDDVRKFRSRRAAKSGDVARQIDQHFQARTDAEAQPAVGAVEHHRTVAPFSF